MYLNCQPSGWEIVIFIACAVSVKVAYKDGMLQRKVALIANHRKNI